MKNQYFIKEKILEVSIDQCFISEITIAELTYGAEKSGNLEKDLKDVEKMEELFSILPIYDSIPNYAQQKVSLQRQGILIPDFDILIGSTAINKELTLVTNNGKTKKYKSRKLEKLWIQPFFKIISLFLPQILYKLNIIRKNIV